MTIAGFYLSPEGVVLGADSTSSVPVENGMLHYFDFNQKVFEIGENSTLGFVTWGMGGVDGESYRTKVARLADDLTNNPATSVSDVMQRWIDIIWPIYLANISVVRAKALHAKQPYVGDGEPQNPDARTESEESEYANLLSGLVVGFCIGGYVLSNRIPEAASVIFDPIGPKPALTLSNTESWWWWGVPNIINRMVYGGDENLVNDILASGNWTGSHQDILAIIKSQQLLHGSLPIRDAIDYVYSSIHCTIKAMKFSNMPQVCGGPIEVAVISTDRNFRWVRHKTLESAITDRELL